MPGATHDVLRHVPELAAVFHVGHDELAGVAQPLEHRVGLDRELVERHVVVGVVEGADEFRAPGLEALVRAARR